MDAEDPTTALEDAGPAGPGEDAAAAPRRGRRSALAVGAAAALFVGAAAYAGAAVQPYLVDRAVVLVKTITVASGPSSDSTAAPVIWVLLVILACLLDSAIASMNLR